MFDESHVKELLDAAKPAVIESLKRELAQTISYDVKQQAARLINEAVTSWVNENIIPEITARLVESKDGLIALGAKIAPAMVEQLAEGVSKTIADKMKESWGRRELFKTLLG